MTDQLHLWPEDRASEGLAWSWSRDLRQRDCLRKYYLHHYVAPKGARPDAPSSLRQVFVLRSLRNRFMWLGEVVHGLIEMAFGHLSRGTAVPIEGLVERGVRTMRAQYVESAQHVYRDRPMVACGLWEHEYRAEVPRDAWIALRDRMEQCLRRFFALPLLAELQRVPQWRWLAVESTGHFEVEGATVVVKPDFAWRGEDGAVVLVDWKTGSPRPRDERLQLATYGLYAQRAWGLQGKTMVGRAVHLEDGSISEFPLDAAALEEADNLIRASLAQMRARGEGERGNQPPEHAYPLTDDTSRCTYCSFKRVCGR